MPLSNTLETYGSVTKTFHWLTALLILSAFPIGYFAHEAPFSNSEELAQKAFLFSLHKTIGIAAFFTALLRIVWALRQIHPGLLNPEDKLEATAAQTAHWLLYGSMLLVPFSGWVHHASTQGFAPIWWPFGQNLPLIPKSEALAQATSTLHFILILVLALTILAHVGGALKHFVIDRDQTLQRMLPGNSSAPMPPKQDHSKRPLALALIIWMVALGLGAGTGAFRTTETAPVSAATLDQVTSDWQVQSGALEITVAQFGTPVTGNFAEWTADITFSKDAIDNNHGNVKVTISVGSLTLGSVTQQAMGFDYFNTAEFPTAEFNAEILAAAEGYVAQGTLTLRGVEMPVSLPFLLETDGKTATMTGQTQISRMDFGIGANQPDEASLGFAVDISVNLTAQRN
ncbi:hypothetical protein NBRC116601_11310 [Cognatishimia sp. WU-CL00825]|uniref:cytochrome b/b6 domain-containing protein n=1 Tax=Cognatishimia sp. WU-CL00825 TaxID=3127658 RepID=UPI00310289FC